MDEESRLREATMNELAQVKESRELLEQELIEARRKMAEEMKQHEKKGSEVELRFCKMQEELAGREAQLAAKEKEMADIQVRIQWHVDNCMFLFSFCSYRVEPRLVSRCTNQCR